MKFLIWFFCFFCMAIVKMFIDGADIAFLIANSMSPYDLDRRAMLAGLIAGLIAMALFSITWWCGKRLCKAWDRHRASKCKDSSVPMEITANTVVSSSNKKLHYCKLCGGVVDPDTKVCGKCGKQYFRFRIDKSVVFLCTIVILSLAICLVGFYRINEYQQHISKLGDRITELEATVESRNKTIVQYEQQISDKNKRNRELLQEKAELEQKVDFYDKNIVFVLDDNTNRYHNYDCIVFKYSDEPYWAYNIEAAQYRGYSACFACD